MLFWIFFIGVSIYLLVAGVSDFRIQRIPNTITVPAAVIGLAFNVIAGMFGMSVWAGWTGLLASLAGFALGMALLFIPFAFGGGGAGDVKFLAALGVWLGPWHLLLAFFLGMFLAAAGGIYKWTTLAIVEGPWKAKEKLGSGALANQSSLGAKKRRKTRLALIVPMAIGCWIVLAGMAIQNSSPRWRLQPWWGWPTSVVETNRQ